MSRAVHVPYAVGQDEDGVPTVDEPVSATAGWGIGMSRVDLTAVKALEPFDFRWPDGVESFEGGWSFEASIEGNRLCLSARHRRTRGVRAVARAHGHLVGRGSTGRRRGG
jgi:hypothetical protein